MLESIAELDPRPRAGIVDMGGGQRGIYGAGVFDWCLENGVEFDYCSGVSAGSANAVTYMAGQKGRTYRFYMEYAFRKEYMSLDNCVHSKPYLDLDYVYRTLSNADGEDPLDYQAMCRSGKLLRVVATDADTARPVYFTMDDMRQDDYTPLVASSGLPIATAACELDGRRYFDGGLSDPIPVQLALDEGCRKVVVILTRERDHYRDPRKDERVSLLLRRRFPRIAEALASRAEVYNRQLDLVKRYEAEGRVLIIAPSGTEGMGTLTKDKGKLEELYRQGRRDAGTIPAFLEA